MERRENSSVKRSGATVVDPENVGVFMEIEPLELGGFEFFQTNSYAAFQDTASAMSAYWSKRFG